MLPSRLDQRARLGVGGREADKQLGRPGMDHLIEYTMKSLQQGTSSSMLKERRMCFRGGIHGQPGRTVGQLTSQHRGEQ